MIEAGAAGVHFEDQLASEKKCGHLGGKVLVPTQPVHPHADRRAPRRRRAATCRPCSSRAPTPTARSCSPATSTRATAPFLTGERTAGGLLPHRRRPRAARSPAASPTRPTPTCSGARPRRPTSTRRGSFAEAIHARVPGQAAGLQLLAVVQLEEEARRRHDRDASSASSARWATSSSSSRWPASTR